MRRTFIAVTSLAVLAGIGPALARPQTSEAPQILVRFDHADLVTEEGVASLYQRLAHAAAEVCAQANATLQGRRLCLGETIDAAVADAKAPALTRYHSAALITDEGPERLASAR